LGSVQQVQFNNRYKQHEWTNSSLTQVHQPAHLFLLTIITTDPTNRSSLSAKQNKTNKNLTQSSVHVLMQVCL